jgi:hypothetical protein
MELSISNNLPKSRLKDWKKITVNLFVWLQEAVAGTELQYDGLRQELETWTEFLASQPDRERLLFKLQTAQALLWCADVAVKRQTSLNASPIEGSMATLSTDPPVFIKGKEGWALDCIQFFSNQSVTHRSLRLPIAVLPRNVTESEILTLVLELSRGGGQIFQHPGDSLRTYSHSNFSKAIEDAWEAVKNLIKSQGREYNFDVRWRVLKMDDCPAEEIEGRSASGAAALGFYHLLAGTQPDDGIIVMAQVDEADFSKLKSVNKIPEKTLAAIKHGGFDTIIVADERDQQEALSALGFASRIRVIKLQPPTLEYLKEIRSRKVDEVLDYLDSLAREMAELPAYYPPRLRSPESGKTLFDELRQKVRVVEDRTAFHNYLAKMREQMRAQGIEVDPRAYANTESDERSKIKMPALPVEWNEKAGERFRRAIILADPGLGKTWILKYEARRIANESARLLRDHLATLDEIALPIFTRLSDLHQNNDPVEEALVSFAEKRCKAEYRSPEFRQFVRDKLNSEKCIILLDARDEVLKSRQSLDDRLKDFANTFRHPRLLITSRIVGYGASPIPEAKEVEIVAFDTLQTKAFAGVWFGDATDLRERFLEMLNQNFQVQGLARIPLIMALMCCVYEKDVTSFPTRRVELYEQCLWGLLRDWKEEKQKAEINESDVKLMLLRLEKAALVLHKKKREVFSDNELIEALGVNLNEFLGFKPEDVAVIEEVKKFIELLKCDGILIQSGEHQGKRLFLFLHRTFHEYLTACALSEEANARGWQAISETVDKKSWLAEWEEVVILLAGKLNDPIPLLQMLSDPKTDDYFRHRLCLAARCLPELTG